MYRTPKKHYYNFTYNADKGDSTYQFLWFQYDLFTLDLEEVCDPEIVKECPPGCPARLESEILYVTAVQEYPVIT
jgi:hypothetical protein